jgi:exodeoxyribonuclease V beta subunit
LKPLDPIAVPLAGTTLIEASAGTGKTYTIATLFLRLLLERRLQVSEILVVTYTRAATAELRDRIRRRLTEALAAIDAGECEHDPTLARLIATRRSTGELDADRRWLLRAVRDFDEAAISTIHGFCQRTLTEHAFESRTPFELELVEQQTPLLREVAQDYFAQVAYGAAPELVEALADGRASAGDLERLATQAVRDPRMPVLPDAVLEPTLPTEEFYAARDRSAALWVSEREAILAELCAPDRLTKTSYPALKIVAKWAPELDALATATPLRLPQCVAKLTTESLRGGTLKKKTPPEHPFFDALTELHAASAALCRALDQRVIALRRRLVDYARARTTQRRRELSVQSFDDLLHQLSLALEREDGEALARRITERHPAALIDEFQDTDPVQYGIFQRLYEQHGGSLFLIGDPKQAIYGFRGADIFAYIQAARQSGQAAYTLDMSFRSDPRLLQATNTLFARARRPFLFPEIQFEPLRPEPAAHDHMALDAPALQILFVPRNARTSTKDVINKGWGNDELPQLIAYEVVQLLRSGATIDGEPVRPRHLAVLCRTNAQARSTQAELTKLRVPTVLDGDSSVFDTEMADELSRVLWAVAQPADGRKRNAALCSSILGVDGESLHRMRTDETGLELWLERFTRFNQIWHERGFFQMLHPLLDEANVQQKLLARVDGERRLTDLLHLGELLQQAAVQQQLGPLALLQWLARMREGPRVELAAESAQLRLEHDEHALKLTTVHRSKGLEYPIVLCPFLWAAGPGESKDVRFHDPEDGERIKLDLGSEQHTEHQRLAEREAFAESLRILYVALTRAKHRCYVVLGRFYKSGLSPLGYLVHQGQAAQPSPEDVEARLCELDDASLRADLRALCDASHGAIGVRDIAFAASPRYDAVDSHEGDLAARTATRVLQHWPRMSSFSRLTADQSAPLSAPAEQGLDLDEIAPAIDELAQLGDTVKSQAKVLLHDFPAGPRPGSLIHSIYEHIDFRRSDPDELRAQVERLLALYGLDPQRHAETLLLAIDHTLKTALDAADPPLMLARIAREQRLDELEFTLSTPAAGSTLSASRLASVLERHRAPANAPDYPERLRALRMVPPTGFLKGFIDLVFRDGERFFIVDYKSNWLGSSPLDYQPSRLVHAMREHHYFLQYHLYGVALHRHLRLRLPGYDYERHFGGVYYLFVRGMSPEHRRGTGVFFDRPELALIEALAHALGAGEATA